ncbi:hypothetical protein [Brucella anthropi]|uniref:hypothetical protein n=1 Tax=Brucella anthropi TaxID=529 RepID=UPI0024478A1E|nr:hypothetical protein [Brucella anthropi]MDG9790551.1 hypothetical protein [Brucella anthropi]MDH0580650.1 hypothetical protein [Brucella anthropi]MDH0817274.1 hypothetical protein [Brucella anthropi]MDH2084086.1 hypothetical protein [Brucella anthropi]
MNFPNAQCARPITRPTTPIRNTDPRALERTPHLRAIEMAKTMQDIAASSGAATFKDLVRAGFTSAEIIEFGTQAQQMAAEWKSESRKAGHDNLADMVMKVKQPVPNRPPMTVDLIASTQFFEAWGRYCASRAALMLDPWAPQRERCICVLQSFLNFLPLLPAERAKLTLAAEQTLPKIPVQNGRALS